MVDVGLRSQTKQLRNECILNSDIALFSSLDLPFTYHMHRLVSLDCSPSFGYEPKPKPGLILRFMKR